jgi:hypothetical protein
VSAAAGSGGKSAATRLATPTPSPAAFTAPRVEVAGALAEFERHGTPKARLKALARSWTEMAEQAARYGCQHGTLCEELAKRDDGLDRRAAKLMALTIDWAEDQFRLSGKRDARDLAVGLIAAIQRTALLTSSFREPEIMTRQAHWLARWIDELAEA